MSYTNYIINDVKSFFKNIDDSSIEYTDELFQITDVKISYYQIFINILFLLIIFGTLYVLYRDYIYRIVNKATRCTDINDIVNFNMEVNNDSYIYNIYIVHANNAKNVLKEFVLKLEYNFLAEETKIIIGEYKNIQHVLYLSTDNGKIGKAFYIFDLEEKKKRYIDYYDKEKNEVYYFDKKKIVNKKYKFFVTSNTDEKLTDNSSIQLAYFVRNFSYNENINLDPIYNILYAIENKKNMDY